MPASSSAVSPFTRRATARAPSASGAIWSASTAEKRVRASSRERSRAARPPRASSFRYGRASNMGPRLADSFHFGIRNAENSAVRGGRGSGIFSTSQAPQQVSNKRETPNMSKKPDSPKDGELSEQQLDKVAGGGEEVRKMETVYVTAK